jgi:hypothetical protein
MPTWGEILRELQLELQNTGQSPFDAVRRRYLKRLYEFTGRNTILYATKWTQPGEAKPELISITEEDVQGLMEVVFGMKGTELDLIVHSPGGSPEATEAIVTYLRSKFTSIRVIVPQGAMSAATMLACSGDRIVMGKHSFLGPIDPQFILQTPLGIQAVPAQAILDQFRKAQEECKNPQLLSSWLPILSQFGPALLVQCENAIKLSQELVASWLDVYMFKGKDPNPSKEIAEKLSSHGDFKSHGRHISIQKARELGLLIDALEDNHDFQERVLSVFHSTIHTFGGTPAVKIIENHLERAFVKLQGRVVVEQKPQGPAKQ